jgi:hypothetical protein
MTTSFDPVVLTVRGTLVPASLEAARVLHNETAGSAQGIAAARSLGDLSHHVFAPSKGAAKMSNAKDGELFFVDNWLAAEGIQRFFSDAHVQAQAAKMFSSRDATVWMRARGAFTFHLPAPMGRTERYLGVIRGLVKSPEAAIEAFRAAGEKGVAAARGRGQLSHELFFKVEASHAGRPELLGIDVWSSLEGMLEHYGDSANMALLGPIFDGPPAASVWEQAPGHWSEW